MESTYLINTFEFKYRTVDLIHGSIKIHLEPKFQFK